MSDERVRAAELEVDRSRRKFIGALQELTRQFEPHRLMQEAWEKAKDKGADLAEDAVDAVRQRPFAATGVLAAIAMFIAREPLIDLAGKLVGSAKPKTPTRRKASRQAKTEAAE